MNIETKTKIVDFVKNAQSSGNHTARQQNLVDAEEVFSVERFRQLLASPLLTPDWLRANMAGKPLDLRGSVAWKVVQDKKLYFMDKEILNKAVANRASVVLEGIDVMDTDIAQLVGDLEQTMPCSLSNCVAFFSRSQNEAYSGHRDSDDVLVIQISGTKRWRLHEPQQRRYVGNAPLTDGMMGPVSETVDMNPGDMMFLRAGVPHKCSTVSDHSLHLSFDLIDRTLNVEQITTAANYQYNQSSADPHVSAAEVVQAYLQHLTSDKFRTELEKKSVEQKKEATAFRQRIVGASQPPTFRLKD
jgi:ribosomal protein L16 Arg81 hydroxylase